MEDWAYVRHLRDQGLSARAIARQTGFSRSTVLKYLRVDRAPVYHPRVQDPELLRPFHDHLKGRLAEFPALTTQRLLDEIREKGFSGSYSTLLRFLRPLRAVRDVPAVFRFETLPGQQAQIDWALFGFVEVDGIRHRLVAFIATLGYSRARYVEFVTDLSTPTFLACHQRAFAYFGGFPRELLYDNLKSVVLARAYLAADSQFNPLFLDFAAYYGFTTRLCQPYRPVTKGKVERSVRVVRQGFFEGRHFSSIQELNILARQWCDQVNQRPHGTTHVAPIDRLEEERLTPVDGRPPYPIVQTERRKISRDCYINYRQNRYSVPWKFAGRHATLRLREGGFSVEVDGQEICHHALVAGAGNVIQVEGHRVGLLAALRRRNQVLQTRLESFVSLPEAPVVERRDLSVYDRAAEENR